MILLNGEYKNHIDISDRGFQYGDGLFETIEVRNGKPIFFDLHLERLKSDCNRLQIPCPSLDLIRQESALLCRHSKQAVLKVIVTRGTGGRGYRQPDELRPTRVLSLHSYPNYPVHYREHGVIARFCQTRLGLNPSLAGIKHLNRLEQVLARTEWNEPSIQEGIMLDVNGNIIEGTMTNLFFIRGNTVYTPALIHAGVNGIIRRVVIRFLTRRNIALFENTFSKFDLLSADEVFVCNSIIGIWPIKQIENSCYQIGPITKQCQIWLDETINNTVNEDQ